MNNPLLSICIPTYNQPKEVERLLNTLLEQAVQNESVEIVIRDDSSNEETKKIVDNYLTKLPIRYFHGEKGGLDRAIIFLTQEAKGEYVWWLGDDDLAPGAVTEVLKIFKNYPEVSFLFLNYASFDRKKPERIGVEGIMDKNKMLELANGSLGFISVTLFKRECVSDAFPVAEKYIGSAFSNLCIVLGALSKSNKTYFVSNPLVINYPNKPEEVNDNGFEVFGINFVDILNEFSNEFTKKSIRKVVAENFKHVWKGVFVRWVTGYESPRGKKIKMLKYYWNFIDIVPALFLLNLPLFINRFFYSLYRKVKSSCKK
jgi:glycosyltransferase involved in cell wall biosynthesis